MCAVLKLTQFVCHIYYENETAFVADRSLLLVPAEVGSQRQHD